jgi:hypothetical protein
VGEARARAVGQEQDPHAIIVSGRRMTLNSGDAPRDTPMI